MKAFKSVWFKLFIIIIVNFLFFISWKFSFDVAEQAIYDSGYNFPVYNLPSSYISENQNKIDIIKYDMEIELFHITEEIRGDVNVTGLILDNTIRQIDLNFYDNFDIENVYLNNEATEYENEDMHLSIPVENITMDTFSIRVVYKGKPLRRGLASFSFEEFKKSPVIYTLNEPVYASTWFPCNDKPDDKALLKMKITNDSSNVSVSNGNLVRVTTEGDKKTYQWETIYPISTYLICIYSADYSYFNHVYVSGNDSMNIDYYVFPEHREMAEVDFGDHLEYMDYFTSVFGEYPFIEEKYGVAEFLWQMGAMEHQTITGIGSNFLNGKRMFNEFYIHELAHQWFGNAVGPGTWKDIWLNEGFASYSEALYSEHKFGKNSYNAVMQQKFQTEFKGTLYDPNYLFSSTVYDKGAWVVHMLRWELGDSNFFKVIKEYLHRYKYKTATTDDLLKLCNEISGNNLTKFFDQWVYKGTGIIKIEYRVEKNNNGLKIALKQIQDGFPDYHFPLEVVLRNKNGEESLRNIIYINEPNKVIDIKADPDSEVLLDPDNRILAEFKKII